MGIVGGSVFLSSCIPQHLVSGQIEKENLVLELEAFKYRKKELSYLIVNNKQLKYPIVVFKDDDENFTALLMKCTHQGTELQVFGDQLQCPAHGSSFSKTGDVLSGPADDNLRMFNTQISGTQLHITLQ